MKNAQFPHLHHDAPQVPEGLMPRKGVSYGCGDSECRMCYMPVPRFPYYYTGSARNDGDVRIYRVDSMGRELSGNGDLVGLRNVNRCNIGRLCTRLTRMAQRKDGTS